MRTAIHAALLTGLAIAGGTGCATTRAEMPRDRPALEVPLPPPRVITPLPAPDPPPPDPVGDLPAGSPNTPSRPRAPRERETPPPKPEQKPEETKPPETPPVAPPAPVPQLRIPETGDSTQVSAQIREIIDRTRKALDGIDYRPLSQLRKKAYDDAKMFYTQAEEALKANNLVFAKELADKAERLSRELQGR